MLADENHQVQKYALEAIAVFLEHGEVLLCLILQCKLILQKMAFAWQCQS
jgi:hypothetical protein